MKIERLRKRMIVTDGLGYELSPYRNHAGTRYSFPICLDIFNRILETGDDIQADRSLIEAIGDLQSKYKDREEALDDVAFSYDGGYEEYRDYQLSGAKWMSVCKKCVMADSVGTGKTITAILASKLAGASSILLVASRAKHKDWIDHFAQWRHEVSISVVSYESILKHEGIKYDLIIADEAHKLRNRVTDVFKNFKKVADKVKNLYLLTGSPNVNNPDDIWTLLHLCDKDVFGSYWGFVYRFCKILESAYGVKVEGIKKLEIPRFMELIKPYVLQRTSQATYDVTEKYIHINMSEKHAKAYRYVDMTADIGIERLNKLLQVTVDPQYAMDFPDCGEHDNKAAILRKVKFGKKTLIFCKHKATTELCRKYVINKKLSCNCINSDVSKKRITEIVEEFQTGGLDVLLLAHRIGGEGLNLTAADTILHVEFPWNSIGIEQANARMLRMGQVQKGLRIFYFITKGTVEEHVMDIIKKKEAFTFVNLLKYDRGKRNTWRFGSQ